MSLLFSLISKSTNSPLFDVTMTFSYCLNSRDLFLNLRRLVKMTKPLRFKNKSLRLKYKCLIAFELFFEPF